MHGNRTIVCFASVVAFFLAGIVLDDARSSAADSMADALKVLNPRVLSDKSRNEARDAIERDLERRKHVVNDQNRAEWAKIKTREQWEKYRDERYSRLRASLGTFPDPPKRLPVEVTSVVKGDGYRIENLLYESRPGQWVPTNLYVPDIDKPAAKSMPCILIAHSHHRHKWEGELQDMGMTWARAGCQVLVIDQFGYGERRAHPFHSAKDYDKEYKSWRQDYYYRYDSGIQLQLAGDSLMGWMTWDLMRGVDLLLARPQSDPNKVIILGSVAGGGDPAGITAALDTRIKACVPFNFGGAQPETRFPLPEDAEASFNYLMGTYWESTRGLRRGGVDGFLHWIIVAGTAPRRLIHAHEFAWDRERDPIWKRYQTIFGEFYGEPDNLAATFGKGGVRLRPPAATHCNNIGKYHRRLIHPAFKRWFDINVTEADEYSKRRDNSELVTVTPAARMKLQMKTPIELVTELGRTRRDAARAELKKLDDKARLAELQRRWSALLWSSSIQTKPSGGGTILESPFPGIEARTVILDATSDVRIPGLLLQPKKKSGRMVIGLAQGGKSGFLKHRGQQIAELLNDGYSVYLPDVRGTGEIKAGDSRDRSSGDGNRSVHLLLYGETLLGQRVRDVQAMVEFAHADGAKSVVLWGDSFAEANLAEANLNIPRGVDGRPKQPEPLGGLLAALTAMLQPNKIDAIYIHRGLTEYHSALTSPHVLLPHDVVVPLVATAGDIADVLAAIPKPIHLSGMTDAQNHVVSDAHVKTLLVTAAGSTEHVTVNSKQSISTWLKDRVLKTRS